MIEQDLRDRLMADPDILLEDRDVMEALIAANERAMGGNVVDLRGLAMEKLAERLDRLEDTHRTVIAAAYDNLAGTNQVHRAILHLLDQQDFENFLRCLNAEVAPTLRVDCIRLALETIQDEDDAALGRVSDVVVVAETGFVSEYLKAGRDVTPKQVTLRRTGPHAATLFGEKQAAQIRSEALMVLDLGPKRLPGLLAFGAADPNQFKPAHGTDLLVHFGAVFERVMRRWLA